MVFDFQGGGSGVQVVDQSTACPEFFMKHLSPPENERFFLAGKSTMSENAGFSRLSCSSLGEKMNGLKRRQKHGFSTMITLQGTKISPPKALLKMGFFPFSQGGISW